MTIFALFLVVRIWTVPETVVLEGARAEQQFLAMAEYADGTQRDVTGEVSWSVSSGALATVSGGGRVAALGKHNELMDSCPVYQRLHEHGGSRHAA